MYGEHATGTTAESRIGGSPPRVRGALDAKHSRVNPLRITPACTGSTTCGRMTYRAMTDHPRVYGEHVLACSLASSRAGSPPRVRGARRPRLRRARRLRITPACTGSTPCRQHLRRRWPDHPRVYGEHRLVMTMRPSTSGSPPRVRGARDNPQLRTAPDRITPACTGSTGDGPRAHAGRADHPRVYGEHTAAIPPAALAAGSPPRVRGAHFVTCGFTGEVAAPER